MTIEITTLCENTASGAGFCAEWGLSILVKVDDISILFDTGMDSAVVKNAVKLGVNLSSIDYIVLSHGHADHTGGLHNVLRVAGEKNIIAHPAIWEAKYTKRPYQEKKAYIGIPFNKEELENEGASFSYSKKPVEISKNIFTTGEIEEKVNFEYMEAVFFVQDKEKNISQDPLLDDLSLIINTEKGLVVILGCAHRGTINHIKKAQEITGQERVLAVVGGTHLGPASDKRIDKTIEYLRMLDVQKIGVSHCTGFHASMRLAQAFGDKFFLNNSGTRYKLIP